MVPSAVALPPTPRRERKRTWPGADVADVDGDASNVTKRTRLFKGSSKSSTKPPKERNLKHQRSERVGVRTSRRRVAKKRGKVCNLKTKDDTTSLGTSSDEAPVQNSSMNRLSMVGAYASDVDEWRQFAYRGRRSEFGRRCEPQRE